ncbi:MAG: alpha/beta hydrolase [Candidatus Eisenbacteria bacterium]
MTDPGRTLRRFAVPWLTIALVSLALAGVVVGAFAWHYSDLILEPTGKSTLREQRVLASGANRIRLSRDRESLQSGTWALQWEDGFGRIGPVLASDDTSVVREFHAVVGTPPVGGWASLKGVSRSADPQSMLGIAFEEVGIPGPLGTYPAWYVPGPDTTWVLYVHGRGANRAEGLRTLGVLVRRGLPALMVTYRNDPGAPRSADRFSHLGLTEWEDVEAAVRYALDHGARDLVLSGYSMGGQIVMQFMSRSPMARHVRAIVLDSPVLSWDATFACRARLMHVPPSLTWLGERTAATRAGLDWSSLDRVAHLEPSGPPILLFHCVHDDFAPESVSVAFARAAPRRVTLIPVGIGVHVEAWNADPAAYADTLHHWLDLRRIGRHPG